MSAPPLNPPFVHMVTWRLNGKTIEDRQSQAKIIVDEFESARHSIQGLLEMTVGANIIDAPDAWDVALYMVFSSRADLDAYQENPAHMRIKSIVGPMRSSRGQTDFELSHDPKVHLIN